MADAVTTTTPRPASVTVAVAVGWISATVDLLGGVALFLLAGDEAVSSALGVEASTVRTMGVVSIGFALTLALVVHLLGKGSTVARMLVTIVMLLRLGFGAWVLVAAGSHQFAEAAMTIALAVAALALLWNCKANDFFAARRS